MVNRYIGFLELTVWWLGLGGDTGMQRHWKNDPTNEFKAINDRDIQGKVLSSMKGETWFRFGDSRKVCQRHWHLSRVRVIRLEVEAEGRAFAKTLSQERVQRIYGKVSLTFSSGCFYLSPGGYYRGMGGEEGKYKERVCLAFSWITNLHTTISSANASHVPV